MKKGVIRSIGAVFAGLLFIAVTHNGTDFILENMGVLPKGNLHVATGLILMVLVYRTVFSLIGCYITARLAPNHPLRHALILGILGAIVSAIGAVVASDLAPGWYGLTLALLAIPIAYVAGKFYELQAASN